MPLKPSLLIAGLLAILPAVQAQTTAEFDVLINEIMADPTPPQGLPAVEWLELFNRSSTPVELSSLRLKDATGAFFPLPAFSLSPGALVTLTANTSAASLQGTVSGTVLGIPVSSTFLNNDGDELTLADSTGTVIDRVSYSSSWHTSAAKRDGGWSLERINPGLPCLGFSNWNSCNAPGGGTPGTPNSLLSLTPDDIAPEFSGITVISPESLKVFFSEGMAKDNLTDPDAYFLYPPVTVISASVSSDDRSSVSLELSESLKTGIMYSLVAPDLSDCSGNSMPVTDTLRFGRAEIPEPGDVILNEIMSDAFPSAGLPVAEWLELYNRSARVVNLSALQIQDKTGSPVSLPEYLLGPGEFVVISALSNAGLIKSVTHNSTGAPLSTVMMNDDGDAILLSRTDGTAVDRLEYSADWHTIPGKSDGGWSLERIDPDFPCPGAVNWQSCPVLPGGTPGKRNASFGRIADYSAPALLRAYPESDQVITLTFSKAMSPESATNTANYFSYPTLLIDEIKLTVDPAIVQLILSEPMDEVFVYQLIPDSGLSDCAGNTLIQQDTIRFGIPRSPERNDLIINEIMFNPKTGEPRYVEIFNAGNKVIDWNKCFIANLSGNISIKQVIAERLSLPGEYVAITTDTGSLATIYQGIPRDKLLKNDLPSIYDSGGNLTLYWVSGTDTTVLDEVNYDEDWNNALLSYEELEGVALERLRIRGFSNDPSNWTSASANRTGAHGTPALPNSQRITNKPETDNTIRLAPSVISPDGDGRDDFLEIYYELPGAGYFSSVTIYDSDGIPVKRLMKTEIPGTTGTLRWDGDNGSGSRVAPGIYIAAVELFHPDGKTDRIKKTAAVY